jgi:hypothetical protein
LVAVRALKGFLVILSFGIYWLGPIKDHVACCYRVASRP